MRALLPAAALLLVAAPSIAAAQQSAPTPATITGEVLDATTEAPVPSALISVAGTGRPILADESGRFVLTLVPGTYEWTVSGLGYAAVVQESVVADGDHFRIGLMPLPIRLEPVVVDAESIDRIFEHRRNAAAVSMRPLPVTELERSAAANMEEFVKSRFGLVYCPGQGAGPNPAAGKMTAQLAAALSGWRGCIQHRGRVIPVVVYIDERYAMGGVMELATYDPRELHTVEVWRHGAEIRVFTHHFMDRVSRGREVLRTLPAPPPGGF